MLSSFLRVCLLQTCSDLFAFVLIFLTEVVDRTETKIVGTAADLFLHSINKDHLLSMAIISTIFKHFNYLSNALPHF